VASAALSSFCSWGVRSGGEAARGFGTASPFDSLRAGFPAKEARKGRQHTATHGSRTTIKFDVFGTRRDLRKR
jgi:hypothetical protein